MFDCPEEIKEIIKRLSSAGYEAYIVGGCVRDYLIGNTPNDHDVTTSATPEDVLRIFSDKTVIKTGMKHGTVTVVYNSVPVEITTFRTDGIYTDNRRPENVTFTKTFRDDAARRDFTMNAIAYSDECGIIDCFGGVEDIKNSIIRAVGDADKRFNEDALRILRAIRFSSVLGFTVEDKTKAAIHKNRELLKNISAERINAEFSKLICGKKAAKVLEEYADVVAVFIPEITATFGFDQHNYHHIYDVWHHTLKAVEASEPLLHSRLAAFFHDIGKPGTFSLDENGTGHFYGHAEKSLNITEAVFKRLKYDNDTTQRVIRIIKYHDVQIAEEKSAVKKALNRLSEEGFRDLIGMYRADTAALAPEYASRSEHFDILVSIADEITAENSCFSLKDLAVNGNDLISLGIPRGKEIGSVLDEVLENVLSEKLPNDKNTLISYIKSTYLK